MKHLVAIIFGCAGGNALATGPAWAALALFGVALSTPFLWPEAAAASPDPARPGTDGEVGDGQG